MKKSNIISEIKIEGLSKEASASFDNPATSKLTFVFTDDQPNGNKKGIPQKAFSSIINTGIYMPLKMAEGQIAEDHFGAVPLGVISKLYEVAAAATDTPSKVVGEAILWDEERPEDVDFLKSLYAKGDKLNISWEVLYSDSSLDENGTEWYLDPIVRGATLVGMPAYMGRTPVLSVASLEEDTAAKWTRAYIDDLPDSAFLYIEPGGTKEAGKTVPRSLRHFPYKDAEGKIDLPHLRNALARIPQSDVPQEAKDKAIKKAQRLLAGNNEAKSQMDNDNTEALAAQISQLQAELDGLKVKVSEYETELASLREYKNSVEKEKADAALLKSRLEAFSSKGITPTAEEIEAKKAYWLKLDDETFNFLVSELASREAPKNQDTASLEGVPGNLSNTNAIDPLEIVRKGLQAKRG